ncbi:ROK family protein [Ruania alkalisoli]|uniref:ROK family protein n=1 Tax=Ruania alkalisoli TaxID=2779775 RepID=A0A7M1STQ7_9MICO|nr:ROK family protein [Ruania alkalisoli]QOR70334.1 ROK family protein [Ruania alkalisoli]
MTRSTLGVSWTQPANKGLIRQINEARVLDVLRVNGPTARARIAQITGLSPATVTQITAQLIEHARIREADSVRSTRGRPAQLLELDRSHVRVIGIDISREHLVAVAIDLTGEVVLRRRMTRRGTDAHTAVDDVTTLIGRLRKDVSSQELVGVGIAVSGTVDAEQGSVVHSGLLGWDDVPLAPLVAERTGLPVKVERYVDSLASAITLFGGDAAQRILIVNVAPSIGVSIVLGGQIHRQRQGRSGPIAHTRIDLAHDSGAACHCGRRGCIETVASQWGIEQQLRADGRELPPQDWASSDDGAVSDTLATGGIILGRALANIAKALDIERVVVAAPGSMLGTFADHAEEAFDAEFDQPETVAPWTVSTSDDTAAARGAACGVLGAMFYVDVNATQPRD